MPEVKTYCHSLIRRNHINHPVSLLHFQTPHPPHPKTAFQHSKSPNSSPIPHLLSSHPHISPSTSSPSLSAPQSTLSFLLSTSSHMTSPATATVSTSPSNYTSPTSSHLPSTYQRQNYATIPTPSSTLHLLAPKSSSIITSPHLQLPPISSLPLNPPSSPHATLTRLIMPSLQWPHYFNPLLPSTLSPTQTSPLNILTSPIPPPNMPLTSIDLP